MTASEIVDILRELVHTTKQHPRRPREPEWLFIPNLRTGTGHLHGGRGFMDVWAMHLYPSKGNLRIAYEIKVSRSDFVREMKNPAKRRLGLMYSNEFFFVAPAGLLTPDDIPTECGLLEVMPRDEYLASECKRIYRLGEKWGLAETLPAPWRDTPACPWFFLAAVARTVRDREAGK